MITALCIQGDSRRSAQQRFWRQRSEPPVLRVTGRSSWVYRQYCLVLRAGILICYILWTCDQVRNERHNAMNNKIGKGYIFYFYLPFALHLW